MHSSEDSSLACFFDGTITSDFLVPDDGWPQYGDLAMGVKVSSDSTHLYLLLHMAVGGDYLYKFDLSDNNQVWRKGAGSTGYDIAIDSDGNVYVASAGTGNAGVKFASAE